MHKLNISLFCFLFSYVSVGRSFFHTSLGKDARDGRGELGDGIEYWRGYFQSLRLTQMGLSLNIGKNRLNVIWIGDVD